MVVRRILTLAVGCALIASVAGVSASASAPASLAKCAPGTVVAYHRYATQHGYFLVEVTKKNDNRYYGCVLTPSQHVYKTRGVYYEPFKVGRAFKRDSLGHVFFNLYPGNISGVDVVVFKKRSALLLGPYAGGTVVQRRHRPWKIKVGVDDCKPNCASGHYAYYDLHWSPAHQDYRR